MIAIDEFKDRTLRLDTPMIVVEISMPQVTHLVTTIANFASTLKIFDFSSLFLIRSIRDVARLQF